MNNEMHEMLQTDERAKMAAMIDDLDKYSVELFDEYTKAMKALDPYRGLPVTDSNVKEINTLLYHVQQKFNNVYPVFHFVNFKAKNSQKIVEDYQNFMNDIQAVEPQLLKDR